MTPSFDLTTEPWLPCETAQGERVELSTEQALTRAHELRALTPESPIEIAPLFRHLLAVLHRALEGPADRRAWRRIYEAGAFDAAAVRAYLERVRDRMDLLHPEHPFGQVPGLRERFGVTPIDEMTLERRGWGTARNLFEHRAPTHVPSMPLAAAARALVAYHAYDTGGLVRKPGEPTSATAAPLLGGVTVLVRGETLFETLCLNLLVWDGEREPVPTHEDDLPSWERPPLPAELPLKKEPAVLPTGWLHMLTWWSRRLELVTEGDQVVGFVRCVGQGQSDATPHEPAFMWRNDAKRGWRPIGVVPERAFWRDAHALFQGSREKSDHVERPKAIVQLSTPEVRGAVPAGRRFALELIGLATNKSSIKSVLHETLWASAPLLADPDAGEVLRESLRFAEEAVGALGRAIYLYARLPRSPWGSASQTRRTSAVWWTRSALDAALGTPSAGTSTRSSRSSRPIWTRPRRASPTRAEPWSEIASRPPRPAANSHAGSAHAPARK